MNTGSILAGRPSLGAWVTYGLGTENQDLPAFVVMNDAGEPVGGPRNWGNAWLPATFQGTPFRKDGTPILHLDPPRGVTEGQQKSKLELIADLDRHHAASRSDDSRLAARIASYELAYRMQAHAPEAVDLSRETAETKQLYGLEDPRCKEYGAMCLRARRLVERGVRFVQLYCGSGSQWDAHRDIEGNHSKLCARSDRPVAAPDQGPEAERSPRLDPGRLGGRVRPDPDDRGDRRSRPQPLRLQHVPGRRRDQARHHRGRHRRVRPQGDRGQGPRPRPPRHDPPPDGRRPQEADLLPRRGRDEPSLHRQRRHM